jgi:hypothetical protein
MKQKLFFILISISIHCIHAQNWQFIDQREGPNNANNVIETYDQGLLFPVFNYDVKAFNDLFLYKLDVNGKLLWKKSFYYKEKMFETDNVLELENGKGYLAFGSTFVVDSVYGDPFIVKFNNSFEPEWFNVYHEPTGYNRIDWIHEYQGKLLVSFAYLKRDYTSLALLDTLGKHVKSVTLIDAIIKKYRVKKDNTIQIFGSSGVFGTFSNPSISIYKSILINIDSNLKINSEQLFLLSDTNFPNWGNDFCFIDENENRYITLNTYTNYKNNHCKVNENIFISKNLSDKELYKISVSSDQINSGLNILKINENRFAINSIYAPNCNNPNQYHGQLFVVDSNANIIYSVFENANSKMAFSTSLIKTRDGGLVTIGNKLNESNGIDFNVFCYKYNQDLSEFQNLNIVKKYDTLSPNPLISSSLPLPEPKIFLLNRDTFLSVQSVQLKTIPNITLFPNPAHSEVNIYCDEPYQLEVYNSLGQIVEKYSNTKQVCLPRDVYYFKFLMNGQPLVKKVVFW